MTQNMEDANNSLIASLQKYFTAYVDNSSNTPVNVQILDRITHHQRSLDNLPQLFKSTAHRKQACMTLRHETFETLSMFEKEINKRGEVITLSKPQYDCYVKLVTLCTSLKLVLTSLNDHDTLTTEYEKLASLNLLRNMNPENIEELCEQMKEKGSDKLRKSSLRQYTTTFNDLVGNEADIKLIQNNVNFSFLKDKYTFMALTGPPGTGKSRIAHAVASLHSGGVAYVLGTGELSAKYVGETEAGIKELFDYATKHRNTNFTIILDEFDRLYSGRDSHLQTVATTLQTEFDGGRDSLPNNIIVVAITNYFEHLESAMKRRINGGVFYIDVPTKQEALGYLWNLYGGQDLLKPEFMGAVEAAFLPKIDTNGSQIPSRPTIANILAIKEIADSVVALTDDTGYFQIREGLIAQYNPSVNKDVPTTVLRLEEVKALTRQNTRIIRTPGVEAIAVGISKTKIYDDDELKQFSVYNYI